MLLTLQKHRINESDPEVTQSESKAPTKTQKWCAESLESISGHIGVGLPESLLSEFQVTFRSVCQSHF